jgi:predicted DCC family thiol-disulfide oxidoreductase YuxK|tara:strand:- start:950 stop:1372 length:423 start_codon:yes stop_codon:yes gene_type:complete
MSDASLKKPELTILIDGGCPLCVMEMRQLKGKDTKNLIETIDILSDDFTLRYPHINADTAMQVLHGELADGTWISGLDVTHKAWTLVGQGWRTSFLRWPLVRPIADRLYLYFASNRDFISKVLTGKSRMSDCQRCNKLGE